MELSLYERMRNKLVKTADNFKEKIENVMYMGSFDDDFFDSELGRNPDSLRFRCANLE